MQEFPLPEIGDEDGLLRVDMVGVCSSDYKYFGGKVAHRWSYPIIMGHEMVGRLARVGKNVQKRLGVKEGDRLVVEAQVGCNQCWYCHTGNRRLCKDAMVYGSVRSCEAPPHLWGAYGQYVYLPPGVGIHKAPEGLNDESAVLITAVLANGVRWAHDLGGISVGDTVVVQGPGPQGLCACAVAKHTGAGQVILTGLARDAKRLETAKRFGADHTIDIEAADPVEEVRKLTGGRMADVVLDVTGSPAAAGLSPRLVRRLGTVVLAGLTGGKEGTLDLDPLGVGRNTHPGRIQPHERRRAGRARFRGELTLSLHGNGDPPLPSRRGGARRAHHGRRVSRRRTGQNRHRTVARPLVDSVSTPG